MEAEGITEKVNKVIIDESIKPEDSLYLHGSDHSSLVLVSDLLREENYTGWSRQMMIDLEARDKWGFVIGEVGMPELGTVKHRQWRKVNSTLVSWLMNSMSKEVNKDFIYMTNAESLWNKLKDRYGGLNLPRLFGIRKNVYKAEQGTNSVPTYYSRLRMLWDEMGSVKPSTLHHDEEERSMQFLMGLNDKFENVKDQILLMDSFPSLSKIYGMILKVDKKKQSGMIRGEYKNGFVAPTFIPTKSQLADLFTKTLPAAVMELVRIRDRRVRLKQDQRLRLD